MKELELILITPERLESYKKDMQEAFQYGYEIEYGKSEELILPEEHINQSLNAQNSFDNIRKSNNLCQKRLVSAHIYNP